MKKEKRELEEFEKYLLQADKTCEKDYQKDFEENFSMVDNWNAISEKLQKAKQREKSNTLKPEPAQNQAWVKPASQNNASAKVVSLQKFWSVAASLTALLLFTMGYHFYTVQNLKSSDAENQIAINDLEELNEESSFQQASLPEELIEAESYYTAVIYKETRELQKMDTAQWIAPETVQTIAELDEAYRVMKKELIEEQNPRILVDKMLENLRLRRQIIEESIQTLEKSSSQNTESNEKSI